MCFIYCFMILFKYCSGCMRFAHSDALEAHSLTTQSCLISIDLYTCVSYKLCVCLMHSMPKHASYHVLSIWNNAWDAYASQTQSSLISSDFIADIQARQASQAGQALSQVEVTCGNAKVYHKVCVKIC